MDKTEVKEARQALGLTQVEFAKALGVSYKAVQSWEQGWRFPSRASVEAIKELGEK
jgi:DNA-binding transcriptional regulator YiaG